MQSSNFIIVSVLYHDSVWVRYWFFFNSDLEQPLRKTNIWCADFMLTSLSMQMEKVWSVKCEVYPSDVWWGGPGRVYFLFSLNPSTAFSTVDIAFQSFEFRYDGTVTLLIFFIVTELNELCNTCVTNLQPWSRTVGVWSLEGSHSTFSCLHISCRLRRRAVFRKALLNGSMKNMWQQCNPSSSWGAAQRISTILQPQL